MLYTLKNMQGMRASITNYGGCIVSILVADRDGSFADVVLGYDDYDGYCSKKYYLGAMIGRCCNRIAKGKFTLNGKEYRLACNDNGKNHLHGGAVGLESKLWEGSIVADATGEALRLKTCCADGEEGYPGRLEVEVICSLSEENELKLHYIASCDQDTLCNLTNHSYFNLAGHDSGSVLEQHLKLNADYFTEADAEGIPTGRVLPVDGTAMDFRSFHKIGDRIERDEQPLRNGNGYDHNWVLSAEDKSYAVCAELYDSGSGRHLICSTNSRCIQVYTGNFIDGTQAGKGGHRYERRSGVALETQFAPDAINHPQWDSPILRAGERFDYTTAFRFAVR